MNIICSMIMSQRTNPTRPRWIKLTSNLKARLDQMKSESHWKDVDLRAGKLVHADTLKRAQSICLDSIICAAIAVAKDFEDGIGGLGPEFSTVVAELLGTEHEDWTEMTLFAESGIADRICELKSKMPKTFEVILRRQEEAGGGNNCAFG
jgi:hypothetical protein